jgi:hypothetical protein
VIAAVQLNSRRSMVAANRPCGKRPCPNGCCEIVAFIDTNW